MKKYITCLAFPLLMIACEEPLPPVRQEPVVPPSVQEETFVCVFEPFPTPVGGQAALFQFIQQHVRYPPGCVEGSVFVSFVVNADGNPGQLKVERGIEPNYDSEAVAVISKTWWVAAKKNGKAIPVRMVMPVKFFR